MAPRSPGLPAPLQARRTADRAVRSVRRTKIKLSSLNASVGFPYRWPTVAPRRRRAAGEADARRRLRHRVGQAATGPGRPLDHHQRSAAAGRPGAGVARDPRWRPPRRPAGARHVEEGRLAAGRHLHANHHSHLDTPLAITAIPEPWRGHLVVGAAADYFFTSHLRARRPPWCSTPSRSPATWPDGSRPIWPATSSTTAGASSSSPRAAARPTAGGSRSRAAPPSCRCGPACPSSRCSSRARDRSSARA